ncbi:MAG: biopolymer transporter ExbD [Bryobacteraceae bacterium]
MAKPKMPSVVADINVTPMVDVMLVMLIIFMVITPMLSKGITVDLVKTKNPIAMADADKEDAILVAVSRDGKSYLGSTQMTPDALAPKVKDMLTNKLSKICYLKVDSRARFEKVVEVVDTLRSVGVDQVGLLTEAIDNKAQGAAGAGGSL